MAVSSAHTAAGLTGIDPRSLATYIDPAKVESLATRVQSGQPVQILVVTTAGQYQEVAEELAADRTLKVQIEREFAEPKSKAHAAHKSICALEAKLLAPLDRRIQVRDRALVAYDDEQELRAREQERAARVAAEREERARRDAEARYLDQQAKATRNPDLREQAALVRAAPLTPPVIAVQKATPKVPEMRFAVRHVATAVDRRQLVPAITRPSIYREVAAFVRALKPIVVTPGPARREFAKVRDAIAHALEQSIGGMPVIPYEAVAADLAYITKEATRADGRLNWPGVTIEREKKTRRT